MQRIAWTLVVLCLAASANAQPMAAGEPAGQDLKCPLDENRFTPPPAQRPDPGGGSDSDGCLHSLESDALTGLVVICPRCNYAASDRAFAAAIPDAKRGALLRVLARSRYRDVTDTVVEVPAWERFRLGAQCAHVLGNADDEASMLRFAVWAARIEACSPSTLDLCRPVASNYGIPLPQAMTPLPQRYQYYSTRGMEQVIDELNMRIADAPKVEEKHRLTLELAMVYERAGFAAKRDEVVAKLGEASASDAAVAAPLARFKKLLGIERDFETQLVDVLKDRAAKAASRDLKAEDHFLAADTLRRLGRDKEAVEEYRAARKLMPQPSNERIYADYFLTTLAPGEPLPAPEPEKVETTNLAPAPEAPKTTETPKTPEAPK